MELGKSRKSSHTSPASTTSSSSSSTTKGVQKFYTKIRHKIEDFPPKITAKLHKNSKQPPSGLTSSSPNGKFTPLTNNVPTKTTTKSKNQSQKLVTKSVQTSPIKDIRKNKDMVVKNPKAVKEDSVYEDIQVVSSNPNGSTSIVYVDSDEECRLSLNDSKISLEDEIFEELEKVAHDEAKLNAVLKNFDKILTDFSQTKPSESMQCKSLNISLPVVSSSSITPGAIPSVKKLQKSKTCSIIESRCILKKSISDPRDDFGKLTMGLGKPCNFNTTKSLWNLKDFEDFAKSGKKLEKIENCKLPVYTGLNKSVGSATGSSLPRSSPPVKINSGRSKSVWELSGSTLSISVGRSKIPIMKSSSILSLSSRSNSFCDVQQKPRSPPNVSKIVKTINDKSPGSTKTFNGATSTPKMSLSSSIGTNQQRRRNLSTAVSTPHSLNRIGVLSAPKISPIARSSPIKPASSEVSLKKSTTPSRLTPLRKQQSSDLLLDKCLEKGHEILRKVEAIGIAAKIDRKNRSAVETISKKSPSTSPAGSISKKSSNSSISPRSYARIKEQSSAKVFREKNLKTADRKISEIRPPKELKKHHEVSSLVPPPLSQDTIDGTAAHPPIKPAPAVLLLYAKEESIKFPRLESCKIIPPVLGKTSEEHAELLVNVKTKQPPIEPQTTAILIEKLCNNESLQLENSPPHHDKDLYPDSDHDSDDSGHISNENDELLTITSGGDCGSSSRSSDSCKEASPPPPTLMAGTQQQQQHQRVVAASTKISELLEKFEITNNNNNNISNLQRQQMLHHHHSQLQHPPSSKKICTAMKIAEVEPVKCIQTHIEIFPTYSKEVILRLM